MKPLSLSRAYNLSVIRAILYRLGVQTECGYLLFVPLCGFMPSSRKAIFYLANRLSLDMLIYHNYTIIISIRLTGTVSYRSNAEQSEIVTEFRQNYWLKQFVYRCYSFAVSVVPIFQFSLTKAQVNLFTDSSQLWWRVSPYFAYVASYRLFRFFRGFHLNWSFLCFHFLQFLFNSMFRDIKYRHWNSCLSVQNSGDFSLNLFLLINFT